MSTIYNQNKVRIPDPLLVEQVINSIDQEILEKILQVVFLPIKELIAPLPKRSHINKDNIPRPQNSFVIYRKDTQAKLIFENGSQSASRLDHVSRVASENWRNTSEAIRNIYNFLAQLAKKIHQETYPDYVYQPKKRSERINLITTTTSSFHQTSSDLSDNDTHSVDHSKNSLDISFSSLPILNLPKTCNNHHPRSHVTNTSTSASFNNTERENSITEENSTSSSFNEISGLRFLLPQLEHCKPIYIIDPYDRKMIDQLPLAF